VCIVLSIHEKMYIFPYMRIKHMNIYIEIDTYTISMYAYMMYMLCKDFSYVNYANVICIYIKCKQYAL